MLKVNEYGERQAKGNEKNLCFKGWETLVLISGADTSNAYHQESHYLTAKHVAILVNIHEFEPVMDVNEYSTPEVQDFRVYGIFKELNYQREVDESTEYLI